MKRITARIWRSGRTTIVDPKLDRELAESIAEALAERKVPTTLDVSEAFDASEGLLMEFLSLPHDGPSSETGRRTTGSGPAEGKTGLRSATSCATWQPPHSVGVGVPAEILETLIPDRDLIPALALLNREHILVADDGNHWRGLHELRSTVARDYLHQFPRPAMATTVRRLVEYLPIRDAGRIIELYARSEVDLEPARGSRFPTFSGRGEVNAEDGARLVHALAMADDYPARSYVPACDRRQPAEQT